MSDSRSLCYAEYIWLDGTTPTQQLRSKTRILQNTSQDLSVEDVPTWGFDGSSTYQAKGTNSDCLLKPVCTKKDPLRASSWLVLCEVFNPDGTPHKTNQRAHLNKLMKEKGAKLDPYVGFEQEYTFFNGRDPLGWPEHGYPKPQGPFYCGVGANLVFGRDIVEEHMKACVSANLGIYGINAEVMPGQWEFQVGPRGTPGEDCDPITMSDHLWLARYLLHAIAEKKGVQVSFSNKPIKGDWNGAGMHTNFSTNSMRNKTTGASAIEDAVQKLAKNHAEHISSYGAELKDRLTGLHETCSITEFRSGVSDRGASIRIPIGTAEKGCGYIEDRRPGANADPYVVSTKLVETIC